MNTLLLDVDGVCASFTHLVIRILKERLGLDRHEHQVTQWDTLTAFGVTERSQRDLVNDAIREEGACASMTLVDGVQQGVTDLATFLHVIPCTAPFPKSRHWHGEREAWVEKHLAIPSSKVIFCHEKFRIHGDYLVDDKDENLIEWKAAHPAGIAIRFARPWNRGGTGIDYAVDNWPSLVGLLRELEHK